MDETKFYKQHSFSFNVMSFQTTKL